MMKNEETTSTSKSGKEKLKRAIRQLENVEILLYSLPKHILKPHKETIRKYANTLLDISVELEKILKEMK